MKHVVIAAAALVLAACATTEGYRQQTSLLMGRPANALLVEMGPPVSRDRMAGGGEVWTYYRQRDHYSPGGPRTVQRSRTVTYRDEHGVRRQRIETWDETVYDPPREWSTSCETRFVIDRTGIVVDFRFEGSDCVAEEIA